MHDPGLVAESKRTAIYARLATRVADGETLPPVADLELQFSDQDPCGRILQELRLTAIARLLPKDVVEAFIEQMRASIKPNFFPGGIGIQAVNHGIVSDCAFGKDGRIELEIRQNDDTPLPSSNPDQSSDAADKKEAPIVVETHCGGFVPPLRTEISLTELEERTRPKSFSAPISYCIDGVPVSEETYRFHMAAQETVDTKPGRTPGVPPGEGRCVMCNTPGATRRRNADGVLQEFYWCDACHERIAAAKVNPLPAESGVYPSRPFSVGYTVRNPDPADVAADAALEGKVKAWVREVLLDMERQAQGDLKCLSCGAPIETPHKPSCPIKNRWRKP